MYVFPEKHFDVFGEDILYVKGANKLRRGKL